MPLVSAWAAESDNMTATFPFGNLGPDAYLMFGNIYGRGLLADDQEKAHEGAPSLHLHWDLSAGKGMPENFFRINVDSVIPGHPLSLQAWVYVEKESVGTRLTFLLQDPSGEAYVTQAEATKEGWQQLIFPLTGLRPIWVAGDKNGRLDTPVKVITLTVDHPDKGDLYLSDLRATSKGTPNEMVLVRCVSTDPHIIAWGKSPAINLNVINGSGASFEGVLQAEATDQMDGKTVWQEKLQIPPVPSNQDVNIPINFDCPNGAYLLKWKLISPDGSFPNASGSMPFARMMGDLTKWKGPAEADYAKNYGLPGGIFYQGRAEKVAQTGGHWEREASDWKRIERTPDKFDFSEQLTHVLRDQNAGLDMIYLSVFYAQPDFYKQDQINFAKRYGILVRNLSQALAGKVDKFEFGNEENGTDKFLFSEVVRHGASQARSQQPMAMTMNGGTAGVDIGWLTEQADRGLFDKLDAVAVHPYTGNTSPNEFGSLDLLNQVNTFVDKIGGMKFNIGTEMGWDVNQISPLLRSQWIPQAYAMAQAAGFSKYALYSFDGDYGIYQNGMALPPAVALNAYDYLTYASDFVGWYQKDAHVWALVYEKGGKPLLMAWSPDNHGTLQLKDGLEKGHLFDSLGNPISSTSDSIALTGAPIYITDLPPEILQVAVQDGLQKARDRYQANLNKSSLKAEASWTDLSAKSQVTSSDLQTLLQQWAPQEDINAPEQATVAQALRWLLLTVCKEQDPISGKSSSPTLPDVAKRLKWEKVLVDSVHNDIDIPALRWLLLMWERNQKHADLCHELGNDDYASSLANLDDIFDQLAKVLSDHSAHHLFTVWPYLQATGGDEDKIQEHIKFSPGKPIPVRVRLNSCSTVAYSAQVQLNLPPDWKCDPPNWTGTISPNSDQEINFTVTANDADVRPERTPIVAMITIPGKPIVKIPFDDFEVLPPFAAEVPVLSTLLPESPLKIKVTNNGNHPVGAVYRVANNQDLPALVRGTIKSIAPGGSIDLDLSLPANAGRPPFNEWNLSSEITTTDGKQIEIPFDVDFDLAVEATKPPSLEGTLDGWETAAPLHMDKEEYTLGSYAHTWTKDDLSGVVYTMWDKDYFYFAAKVRDNLFNQQFTGTDMWQQDSVQVIFSSPKGPNSEFILGLSPKGPELVKMLPGNISVKYITQGKLVVKPSPGLVIYTAAIPWSEIEGVAPAVGTACRFDVLFNDDDVLVKRRFMERYGHGIVNTKNREEFGWLHLGSPATPDSSETPKETNNDKTLFYEDFEEYAPDQNPDVWQTAIGLAPIPNDIVRPGVGRNGGKALEISNTSGPKPNVFRILTRTLPDLVPGRQYCLTAWVKGSHIASPSFRFLTVCSDIVANQPVANMDTWKPSDDWQQVGMTFTQPAGGLLRVAIVNNSTVVQGLLLDDIKIVEVP